jgi:ribosomal-protein-alanine N-acetyltransferase
MILDDQDVLVRWMIRRDVADVLKIEQEHYSNPWTEQQMLAYLRERSRVGYVAVVDGMVVGYMLTDRAGDTIEINGIAVASTYRREGIGTILLAKAKKILTKGKIKKLETVVLETNMPAIQFLRSNGFLAIGTVPKPHPPSLDDGYQMQYTMIPPSSLFRNRIAGRR